MTISIEQQLIDAVRMKDLKRIGEFLRMNAQVNVITEENTTALHEAVKTNDMAVVKKLVEVGKADVNISNAPSLTTPLALAAEHGHLQIFNYLAEAGGLLHADDEELDEDGFPKWMSRSYDEEGAGRLQRLLRQTSKKKKPASVVPPLFEGKTLSDIFAGEVWAGRVEDMKKLWDNLPTKFKKGFDFDAALSEAQRLTLQQQPQKKIRFKGRKP